MAEHPRIDDAEDTRVLEDVHVLAAEMLPEILARTDIQTACAVMVEVAALICESTGAPAVAKAEVARWLRERFASGEGSVPGVGHG